VYLVPTLTSFPGTIITPNPAYVLLLFDTTYDII
jgi:hypothetical protein